MGNSNTIADMPPYVDDACFSPSKLLALTAPPEDFKGPIAYGSPSTPEKTNRFEQAGWAFERKLSGLYSENEDDDENDAVEDATVANVLEEDCGEQAQEGKEEEAKKKKKKTKDGDKEPRIECYEVLGLAHLEIKATEEDIKKAYRKLSSQYHPDKAQQNGADPEEVAEKFKVIQEAYETLTDPVARIIFDSVVPDKYDSIPTGEEVGDFFEIYGPVFERFSRWSEVKPCP